MATLNVRIIHPTNNSVVDLGLPDNILLRDVFVQLVEENVLSAGQAYDGVLKPSGNRTESVKLDNDKTIAENGVGNNDTILVTLSTKAG